MARARKGVSPWTWAILGLFSLGALVGIGLGIAQLSEYFDLGRTAAQADEVAAVYRAAGLPWEAKDIRPQPPVRREENAAPLLRQAIAGFDSERFDGRKIGRLLDKGDLATAARQLTKDAPALSLATRAAERPRLDFARDWDVGGYEPDFPEIPPVRSLIQALSIRAQLRALQGDAAAAADLRSARRLAALIGQEPSLPFLRARLAGERIVDDGVQRCAATLASDPFAVKALRDVLSEPLPPASFPRALAGEAYLSLALTRNFDVMGGMAALEEAESAPAPQSASTARRTGIPRDRAARALMVRHMQVWTEAKGLIDRHRDDPVALEAALARLGERVDERLSLSNRLNPILFPIANAGSTMVAVDAGRLATQALLDALMHRARTGSFPARIQDLPGEWRDPFGKAPLRLKRTKSGLRIYSLGPNRRDDGGVDRREIWGTPKSREKYDIVASFPPVKRPR